MIKGQQTTLEGDVLSNEEFIAAIDNLRFTVVGDAE
jgi:hypothetical protein